jgi:thiamine transport system substrate-binding protein
VAEVVFAEPMPDEAPTGVMTDGCFRQIEFAGVLRGAANPTGGQRLIDFMLTPEFQADIPLNMFVFPARPGVALPDDFVEHAATVAQPLTLAPGDIAASRERWLQEWTDAVLR